VDLLIRRERCFGDRREGKRGEEWGSEARGAVHHARTLAFYHGPVWSYSKLFGA
jgi:hypothetical protein